MTARGGDELENGVGINANLFSFLAVLLLLFSYSTAPLSQFPNPLISLLSCQVGLVSQLPRPVLSTKAHFHPRQTIQCRALFCE